MVVVRELTADDVPSIVATDGRSLERGLPKMKPASAEHVAGKRLVLLAGDGESMVSDGSLWSSTYQPFCEPANRR